MILHIYSTKGPLSMRRVIKIGTSSTLSPNGQINQDRLGIIGRGVRQLCQAGDTIALVTSGAVGAGHSIAPGSRAFLAAVGQVALAEAYRKALAPLPAAQILIDHSHIAQPSSAMALQSVIHQVWNSAGIPLINENDALGASGQRIGDNDTLGALVAGLIGADQLVILSDIDGLYTDNPFTNPQATRISSIPRVSLEHVAQFGDSHPGPWGSGGIASKIKAAHIAQGFGIQTLLAAGHDDSVWDDLLSQRYENFTRFAGEREA
jgi:glutamate 5-kinase